LKQSLPVHIPTEQQLAPGSTWIYRHYKIPASTWEYLYIYTSEHLLVPGSTCISTLQSTC